jgi:hypothetical protein
VIIRIRYEQKGAHIHCRLFTAKGDGFTFAFCGGMVFSEEEWNDVRDMWNGTVEFVPEERG